LFLLKYAAESGIFALLAGLAKGFVRVKGKPRTPVGNPELRD
jgi:hypothetical protein